MLLNSDPVNEDIGYLFLRIGAGGTMFWQHGWPKLMEFSKHVDSFADPFGLGSTVSLILILFAEVLCAACVTLGIWTRAACIPLIIGMAVVVFMVKGDASFPEKELATVYMVMFATLLFTGSGRFAINRISFS
ncbi:MAG: DoxX family protein [Flavobacteriales bacterium]|jgi:putative oxidoreductase|nr:DoxX family protein [Flavobacteriales bacterium]MBK6552136.1 DoxX family protein [Flavobacteriales bacterium]MBK6883173.1 DoxX family protein [Flavobacteriales bacterium]MBK7103211.1 DoxX family protein [Flavobacteriales bacterium]MBK7112814.1 DoxX family protein [Flavobacteriales bacterium]